MRLFAFGLLLIALTAGSLKSAEEPEGWRSEGCTMASEEFVLTNDKPVEAHFQIKLIEIRPDGTTTIESTQSQKRSSARPSEYFSLEGFGVRGLELLKADAKTGEASFQRWTSHSQKVRTIKLNKDNPTFPELELSLISISRDGDVTIAHRESRVKFLWDTDRQRFLGESPIPNLTLINANPEKLEVEFRQIKFGD